jgi:hypothetical protein
MKPSHKENDMQKQKHRTNDIADMKRQIAALTKGRPPASSNRRYLQIRLAELRRGVKVPTKRDENSGRAVPLTISMGVNRLALLDKMCSKSGLHASKLVRKALDEYAVRHGFGADVERLTQLDRKAGAQ